MAFRLDGHTTRVAHNGADAVDAVREEHFDAIIMDVEMPKLNGWDATGQIRTLPHGETVPIIMFTAYGTQADRKPRRASRSQRPDAETRIAQRTDLAHQRTAQKSVTLFNQDRRQETGRQERAVTFVSCFCLLSSPLLLSLFYRTSRFSPCPTRLQISVSARSWFARRVSNRMVVLHRPFEEQNGAALWLSTNVFSHCSGA